jgi:hypothetical protein
MATKMDRFGPYSCCLGAVAEMIAMPEPRRDAAGAYFSPVSPVRLDRKTLGLGPARPGARPPRRPQWTRHR